MSLLVNNLFSITFPSSTDHLQEVESVSSKIAAEAGFDESDVDDLSIAITEIFNNAILHGNKNDANKSIEITYTCNKTHLIVSIKDEGTGFTPEKIRNPLAPENLLAENGRGLYLAKNLMDEIKFNFSDQGTEVLIYKSLPQKK